MANPELDNYVGSQLVQFFGGPKHGETTALQFPIGKMYVLPIIRDFKFGRAIYEPSIDWKGIRLFIFKGEFLDDQ